MKGEAGLTLIEMIVVLVIIGIIAAVSLSPVSFDLPGSRLEVAARRLRADIRYAQEMAMSRSLPHRVRFATNLYAIVNDRNGNGTWGEAGEFARDPFTGRDFTVTLNQGEFRGVTLASVILSCPGEPLPCVGFNSLGVPTGGGIITLQASGATESVTVVANTGSVQ